jgi:hypothetical protein
MASTTFIVGTCMSMCPDEEREERIRIGLISDPYAIHSLHRLESEHASLPGVRSHDIMVKRFDRPVPGDEGKRNRPCVIRPPEVLARTMEYLVHKSSIVCIFFENN